MENITWQKNYYNLVCHKAGYLKRHLFIFYEFTGKKIKRSLQREMFAFIVVIKSSRISVITQ